MDVFVYGTLTDPETAVTVLDEWSFRCPAVLDGLHRVDGSYPTLAPCGSVEGRVLRTDQRAALDRYEGVERGLYVRVSVPIAGSDGDEIAETVEVYVGDPDGLDAPVDWPGDGPFANCVRSYVDEEDVTVELRDADESGTDRNR